MIQTLRRQFVCINMICVSVVLFAIFAVLIVFTVRDQIDQLNNALEISAGLLPPPNSSLSLPPEEFRPSSYLLPTFTVEIEEGGTLRLTHVHNTEVEPDFVEQAAALALEHPNSRAFLPSLHLRFLKLSTDRNSTVIAFVDTAPLQHPLVLLLLLSLLAFAGAMLIFLAFSLHQAKISLRPVEQAWQQQRQFVADASHELKTPLSVIRANTDLLLSHPEDTIEQQRKWLEYIRSQTARMGELIDGMLFLARADQTSEPPFLMEENLSDLFWSCLLSFESRLFESGLTLDTDIEEGIFLPCDREQVRRLIDILLDNACKYTPAGGRVLAALCRNGAQIRLSVSNFGGEPIPPEAQARLFERFYRATPSRARSEGGYGLGLSIAQAVAAQHRGQITVHSTAGDGTTFTVQLPLADPKNYRSISVD